MMPVPFCDWLSRKEGKKYRLPTEAEWEYACRAGTTTRFSCGEKDESLQGYANLADAALLKKIDVKKANLKDGPGGSYYATFDDGHAFTSPVGAFKPNPLGLFDMHGNAWQWCGDFSKRYGADPEDDPFGKDAGPTRRIRGGSWFIGPVRCRSANRVNRDAGDSFCFVGFRIGLTKD